MRMVKHLLNACTVLLLLILAAAAALSFTATARAQTCGIGIGKSAVGAGDLEFQFVTENPSGDGEFTLIDGQGTGGPFTGFIVIRELPTDGWLLRDVECEGEGVTFTRLHDGVRVVCDSADGGGGCTFINVPFIATNIPTLSEWGMIAAAAGLAMIGVFFAVRRRRAFNT